MIDAKTQADSTYRALLGVLQRYRLLLNTGNTGKTNPVLSCNPGEKTNLSYT